MSQRFVHAARGGPGMCLSRQYCATDVLSRYAAARPRRTEQYMLREREARLNILKVRARPCAVERRRFGALMQCRALFTLGTKTYLPVLTIYTLGLKNVLAPLNLCFSLGILVCC